jgi:UDP-N-acetylmuramate dehydrogenase
MTKLSAAWLIEQCGLKGYRLGNAAVSDRHALVLVNTGDASGGEIWQLALHVRSEVERCFGVSLQAEPRIVHLT